MVTIAFIILATHQDGPEGYSIILHAPKKYQRMLRSFEYQDFEKIRTYCKAKLRIESHGLIRPKTDNDEPRITKNVTWIRRDSKKKSDIDFLNQKFQDFGEGLELVMTEKESDRWTPSSGPLDIVSQSGFGYAVRPCAGYYVRLQIDPNDSRHPICGWFETVR
ncbi:MAG: hypothetical protein GC165_07850 [Armatimonadetes bacterium]|nr:hypothetical protein [Armatimonadota bacterium]